jgi:nicotinate-nucleotide pyrophosphorylase (carboxylating)
MSRGTAGVDRGEYAAAMSDPDALEPLVARALEEDLGDGDLTSEATVPADARARARIVQKQAGVLFGFDAAREVFRQTGAEDLDALVVEGQWWDQVPAEVALISGPARALLAAERVALNLLGHLSGVATLTARFVEAARDAGGRAAILDTRKTTPGLRALEKAAVRAGGGASHRSGLYDAILIKENHIALAGGLGVAVEAARAARPGLAVEVECSDAAEVEAALASGAERLLLDNMNTIELAAAVAARDASGSDASLEASGGVDLDTVGPIAATGVEFVSVGALTHSAPSLDLSMLLEPV